MHDTIVVYDRIRENRIRHAGEPFDVIVNHSLLQTVGRSLNTSLTTVLVLTALLLFGSDATRAFVFAMVIGIISGTYSSIFNASALLVDWHLIDERAPSARVRGCPRPLSAVLTSRGWAAALMPFTRRFCLGVDPDPEALPDGWPRDVTGVERFANLLLDSCIDRARPLKINLAFFEAFGSAGIAALERVRARIPADVPFIADAKRGDIGSTVRRQAVALFDILGADAVTANPYLGREPLAALFERDDRFVYVLCRTSNPGAAEIQNLLVDETPLYIQVAHRARDWGATARQRRPRRRLDRARGARAHP